MSNADNIIYRAIAELEGCERFLRELKPDAHAREELEDLARACREVLAIIDERLGSAPQA